MTAIHRRASSFMTPTASSRQAAPPAKENQVRSAAKWRSVSRHINSSESGLKDARVSVLSHSLGNSCSFRLTIDQSDSSPVLQSPKALGKFARLMMRIKAGRAGFLVMGITWSFAPPSARPSTCGPCTRPQSGMARCLPRLMQGCTVGGGLARCLSVSPNRACTCGSLCGCVPPP